MAYCLVFRIPDDGPSSESQLFWFWIEIHTGRWHQHVKPLDRTFTHTLYQWKFTISGRVYDVTSGFHASHKPVICNLHAAFRCKFADRYDTYLSWCSDQSYVTILKKNLAYRTWKTTQTTMRGYKYTIYKKCSLLLMFFLLYSMVWVRKRTIPTERPPLVGEVIANFCG
jgi:hypothetical protein